MKERTAPFGINLPELLGGGALVLFGAFVVLEAATYDLGSVRRMGPGYFPMVLGAGMMVLGGAVIAEGRVSEDTPVVAPFRPLAAIIVSMLAFAVLVERFGLLPAAIGLIFISSFAQPRVQLLPTAILAVGIAGLGALIFLQGFGIPLPIFRW